jgi:tetratricopeptide (TPR) repeat protein
MTAVIYERMKDYPNARDAYEKVLTLRPDWFLALNNLAYLYAEHFNRLDRAYELAQKARNLNPGDGIIADTFGWIVYKRGDYQQALASLQDSAAKFPDNPEVQYHLGMAQYMMGNTDQARAALQKAVRAESDFSGKDEAQKRLAQLENSSSKEGLPGQIASKTSESHDVVALLSEAESYQKQGDSAKAAATYEQALKLNPKLAAAALKLAQLYSGPLGKPAQALDFAKRAREMAPNDPKTTGMVGRIALQAGNPTWSYSLLQESARNGPSDPDVLHDLAMAAYALGKVPEARETMQRALNANPDPAQLEDGKRFLAMTALEQPSPEAMAAQSEIENILKTQPGYLPALMAQAAVDLQRNDSKGAAGIYSDALRKYPDFAPAQKRLAVIYAEEPENLAQAYDLAMKARKALPADADLARTLAELSFKRNEFSYAVQLFQESNAKQPLAAKDLYCLGMAQLQSRQEAQGRKTLEQALAAGLSEPLASEVKKRLSEQPPN